MQTARKLDLKQHFTDAPEINSLMCELLGSVHDSVVLEPSVGHGAFLKNLIGLPREIHAVDVDGEAIAQTKKLFPHLPLHPHNADFVDLFASDVFTNKHPLLSTKFDAVISNPPFGLYFSKEYRSQLKGLYPHLYVRESYGLFFVFSVSLLRPDGRYVFLLPDTFLTSTNHKLLRRFIVSEAAPSDIVRFPSKRFETINFGYGNLCIIAGSRRPMSDKSKIRWWDVFDSSVSLTQQGFSNAEIRSGAELRKSIDTGWTSRSCSTDRGGWSTLGEIADCKTGIYTGDNVRFIGYDPKRIPRRINGHPIDWNSVVETNALRPEQQLEGLSGAKHYVPMVRGGHRSAFEEPSSAIDWSPDALRYYLKDPKARFQNSGFYFKDGLSVPMVSTKRISAAYMTGAVFDQGVVGVFPHDLRYLPALLLYLNSTLASQEMKAIVNGSANNSANYLKRLPVPCFNDRAIDAATKYVASARKAGRLETSACDKFISDLQQPLPRKIAG